MPKKIVKRTSTKTYSIIAGIFTLVLFTLLAISSIILQKQLRQSQDIRQEAWSSPQGAVYVSTNPAPGSVFNVNEPVTIQVVMNTTTASIDGIQLMSVLNGSCDVSVQNNFSVSQNEALNNTTLEIQTFETATQPLFGCDVSQFVKFLAITDNPELTYTSNNTEQALYTYTFTPTTTGTFSIAFSDESFAINSYDHASDELRTASDGNSPVFTFHVVDPTAACYETDGGRDYENYGETTGELSVNVPIEYAEGHCEGGTCADYCVTNDPDIDLNEWFCYTDSQGETAVTFERRICDNGCLNGACVAATITPTATINPSITPTATPPVISSCPAPDNFSVQTSSVTCHDENTLSLTLEWDEVVGATQYLVFGYNLLNPSQIITETLPASQTSYTVSHQDEGPWYFVVAVHEAELTACNADLINVSGIYTTHYCEDDQPLNCGYTDCQYGACNNGYRSVTCHLIDGSDPECAPSITNNEVCMNQCVYSCADWSTCGDDHLQTRTCNATNTPCWDYSGNNHGNSYTESRYCNIPNVTDILFGSYELCWYGNSDGVSTYIAWVNSQYPNVDWVDVSPQADFSRFAHKNVEGADLSNGYGITNGQNFFWHDNGERFYFSPETTYYARLYYHDNQGYHHSRTVTFRMARCAGTGGPSYRQCNQSCNNNSECATGLTCHNNVCRLPTNLNSEICLDPTALKGCAEWCADNRECETGLTCWYNYCRNPKNIDVRITDEHAIALELDRARQTNCADWHPDPKDYYYIYYSPANQQQPTKGEITETKGDESTVEGCNDYCSSNAQCEMNMRCYKNSCRLAVNPESTICDANDKTGAKGDSSSASSSASTTTTTPNPKKFYLDNDTVDQEEPTDLTEKEEEVASQTILDVLREYLENKGISLKTLAILAGALLLVLIILIVMAAKDQSNPRMASVSKTQNLTPPPSAMGQTTYKKSFPPAPRPTTPMNTSATPPPRMISRLQDKGVTPPPRNV